MFPAACQSNSLGVLEVHGLGALSVGLDIKGQLLTFRQRGHSRGFQSCGVNEHVLCAAFRCDKSKAFRRIVKFHCANGHDNPFANDRPDGCQEGENIKSGSAQATHGAMVGLVLLLEQSPWGYAPLQRATQDTGARRWARSLPKYGSNLQEACFLR